jgi:hypothetical protein
VKTLPPIRSCSGQSVPTLSFTALAQKANRSRSWRVTQGSRDILEFLRRRIR